MILISEVLNREIYLAFSEMTLQKRPLLKRFWVVIIKLIFLSQLPFVNKSHFLGINVVQPNVECHEARSAARVCDGTPSLKRIFSMVANCCEGTSFLSL